MTLDTDMSYGGNKLVLDPRSEPKRLVDEAIDHCRDLNVIDENALGGELWFWLQSHRAEVSRKLWNNAGRAAIAAEKTTATTDVDKAACAASNAKRRSWTSSASRPHAPQPPLHLHPEPSAQPDGGAGVRRMAGRGDGLGRLGNDAEVPVSPELLTWADTVS